MLKYTTNVISIKIFCSVHALVYEPTTGEAKMLKVDFGSYLRELRSVYDLYRVEDDVKNVTF